MKYFLKKEKDSDIINVEKEFIYDDELDDFSSISSDISSLFSDSNLVFELSLNKVQIPVELWGDFPYFLDSFKNYIDFLFLDNNDFFTYWLNGQGIETSIKFELSTGFVSISEEKFLKSKYGISINELKKDAIFFFNDLLYFINLIMPNMRKNDWFINWENYIKDTLPAVP